MAEAAARDARLQVVNYSTMRAEIAGARARSRRHVAFERAVNATRERWPSVPIEAVTTPVETSNALLAEAIGADLLVVTALDTDATRRSRSGSKPSRGARRSSCPVVVVRGNARRTIQRIVVGIDTSNAAVCALDWSIDEARLLRAELLVVHSQEPHARHKSSARANELDRADAQCVVDLAVRHCEKRVSGPVKGVVVEGSPGPALVAAGRSADLVVVGSRGCSGFATLLFGSVASFVADHASCPVTVVHPRVRDSSL